MDEEILVTAHNLTKTYNGTKALDELSFELRRGEILGLLGLLTPTSGTVSVLGLSPFAARVLPAAWSVWECIDF